MPLADSPTLLTEMLRIIERFVTVYSSDWSLLMALESEVEYMLGTLRCHIARETSCGEDDGALVQWHSEGKGIHVPQFHRRKVASRQKAFSSIRSHSLQSSAVVSGCRPI